MPATINGTTGFGGNLTGNVTGTSSAVADGAVSAAKLDGAQTGSAPIYGCRAWVNFDGTTSPPTIRASGNVTNVTKNATGDYTINFTTAMSDANYSAVSSVGAVSSTNATLICAKYAGTSTSASFRIQSTANASSSTYYDLADINVQFFR
jgi:leucyl aminopeptidase